MSKTNLTEQICVVIGASHAGVHLAFALRNEGWLGRIILFDSDPELPYHRPPLSKAYLTSDGGIEKFLLKPVETYEKENIELQLGKTVVQINRSEKHIVLSDNSIQSYDTLVLATGARPLMPPIKGIENAENIFPLRTAHDVNNMRNFLQNAAKKQVVVIGGGYIGLEIAASLKKLDAQVTILEREERILARVTAPEMSAFFQNLHTQQGVNVFTNKNVTSIEVVNGLNRVHCTEGGAVYEADMIIVGVGIRVNTELAEAIGLTIENGIKVDAAARTSDENIFAIGDCTAHFNPHYGRFVRLESVQNAVDQSKIAAAAICGKNPIYNTIPWFWSDQYAIKLQMVGLSTGYDNLVLRKEEGETGKFSVWYFQGDELLAVDAVNNAKAYVLGTKFIKDRAKVNKENLLDATMPLKAGSLLME